MVLVQRNRRPASSASDDAVALEAVNLETTYARELRMLRGLTIQVGLNETVALLGANGAGKSTLCLGLTGTLPLVDGEVVGGSITVLGTKVTNATRPWDLTRLGLSYAPERNRVFSDLSVDEHLRIGASVYGPGAMELAEEMLRDHFHSLNAQRRRRAGYLSGGEQTMLTLLLAFMGDPLLVILDEPLQGLAPILRSQLSEWLQARIATARGAMLLVEQNASIALELATRAYVLENGRVVAAGTSDELLQREDIWQSYLGLATVEGERRSYRQARYYERRKRWFS